MTAVQAKKWRRWESNPREVPPNTPRKFLTTIAGLLSAIALALPAAAESHVAGCHTRKCDRRIHQARVTRWLWRHYKAHPMPYCTWAYESGTWGSPWRRSRYRARNSQSTAGGKFQILDQTWFAYGGRPNGDSYPAAAAPPLEQEKIARRVLAGQGLRAWVGC